ncbi:Putative cyclase [Variovorax sp. PBL-H6]|uniref:cyclase family protein n=1 Tax=Variovorax sp. PBL-H6 TaxID=434009 RepID=UPI001318D5F7|nr:cyclase family protein [Variovorax sp. PBL-H6]VTU31951.1 Putative cyclase [Variovorax sp. PBL-H6]
MRWKNRPEGSNWGDFGADDQVGRMNLITPARRLAAVREVTEGLAFPLSLPLDYPGGGDLVPSRRAPRIEATRRATGELSYNFCFSCQNRSLFDVVSDDAVTIWTQYSTQWDALAHWGQEFDADDDGKPEVVYYNGWRGGEHVLGADQEGGPFAKKLGMESLAETAVQGRGVMVDLAVIYGEEPAQVGYDGLMRALERQQATVEPGDFMCLYTGWADLVLGMNKKPDFDRLKKSCAVLDGKDPALLNWITDSGLVAICADNLGVEAVGSAASAGGGPKHSMMPLHAHCIFKLGIFLGEIWYFGELGPWLRARGRSRFLLTAPPLRLPGLVGSPPMPVGTV